MSSRAVTLEERLHAVRSRRMASRISAATTLAAWIAAVSAVLTVVGSSLLNVR